MRLRAFFVPEVGLEPNSGTKNGGEASGQLQRQLTSDGTSDAE